MDDQGALLRELMAVFDQLPAGLREAINYAPEPLDPLASHSNYFIRIYSSVRFLAKEFFYHFLYFRNTGRAPNKNYFINLRSVVTCVF